MFRTPLNLFRALAVAEAVSWTLLIAGLIVRAVTDVAIATTVAGAIHGFVFLSYGATAVLVSMNQRWKAGIAGIAIVSAVIPYATIPVELWLHRSGRLVGAWRIEEPADADEHAWYDRPMRWFLRRPWLLGGLIALAVVALYVSLLLVGPPGGGH